MKRRTAILSLAAAMMIALAPVKAQAGWVTNANGTKAYTVANGSYATGWKLINGKSYYFGTDGVLRTGWQKIGDYTYYLGTDGARAQGWTNIKSGDKTYRYYFTEDRGRLLTGFRTLHEGKKYYFSPEGPLQYGWIKLGNDSYYSDPATGELYINKWLYTKYAADEKNREGYYFDENGKMAKNKWLNGYWFPADGLFRGAIDKVGKVTENGKTYFYVGNRQKYVGFQIINGSKYYFAPAMKTNGWFKVGGKSYYATKSGALYRNKRIGKRFVNAEGEMVTGWFDYNNKTYYFNSNGECASGWKTIDGKKYYFSKSGVKLTNRWIKEGKKGYRLGADGAMVKGMYLIGKDYYFFSVKDGAALHGFIASNGKGYYAPGKNFKLYRNKVFKVGKSIYYAKGDCSLAKGLIVYKGKTYYFDNKCRRVNKKLVTVSGASYYFGSNGAAVTSKWQKVGKKTYYFGADGKMVRSGSVDGYYINADGTRGSKVQAVEGWKTVDGKKYYYVNSVASKGWQTISGSKYYFNADGVMVTGVTVISNKKYYFYPSGKLAYGTSTVVPTDTGAKEIVIASNGVITSEKNIVVPGNTVGSQIAREGLKYIGNPYVWGGESLTNGADCSGFTLSIFKKFGIKLGHYTDWQLYGQYSSKKPTKVTASQLLPGDLIFYGDVKSGTTSHVGIYIGNNQIVHASNSQPYPAGGIKISDYRYNSNIVGMVRYW